MNLLHNYCDNTTRKQADQFITQNRMVTMNDLEIIIRQQERGLAKLVGL